MEQWGASLAYVRTGSGRGSPILEKGVKYNPNKVLVTYRGTIYSLHHAIWIVNVFWIISVAQFSFECSVSAAIIKMNSAVFNFGFLYVVENGPVVDPSN
jgi:hypothetical protein